VHAHPTNGVDEYQGMPMFAEVGPLTMDESVYKETQEFIKKPEKDRSFEVIIKTSNIDHLNQMELPLK